jgi:nitroreductase
VRKITTRKFIVFKKPSLRTPILKELRERFSPRYFSVGHISDKTLRSIFEAARWAPSGYNHQPWFFYWTRKGSLAHKKIVSCLPERNHWAKTAPVFIVSCYLPKSERGTNRYARHDLGGAVMSMIIQAQSRDIYARQIGIFNEPKLRKLLRIPKEHLPFVIIAMGKLGNYSTIDKTLLKRELQKRTRKAVIARKI